MVFVSPIFLFLFLVGTLAVYGLACLTGSKTLKNLSLLGCSLAFYAWGGVKYALLLMFSTVVNYIFGLLLGREKGRRTVLVVSVIYNIGILFFFKYLNFFADTAQSIADVMKLPWNLEIPAITLPIGISFFTFQIMSYVFDVYNRKVQVQKNIFDLALYIMLFPQLIAGPIVRYIDVNKEIKARHTTPDMIHEGIVRFEIGFCKKIFLANNMGYMADMIFANTKRINTPYAWLGAICYALQIYMDFSSYSDMAIGLGKIFGFHFLENFNYPYISKSVKEFWRRWHISLSSWFRDYVYIPLGGSRCGTAKTYRNLLIIFLLTGFWHGANWTFVVWGLFHGVFLVLERGTFGKLLDRMPAVVEHVYTLVVVLVGWVFFRSDSMGKALIYIKTMFSFNFDPMYQYLITENLDKEFVVMFAASLVGSLPLAQIWKSAKLRLLAQQKAAVSGNGTRAVSEAGVPERQLQMAEAGENQLFGLVLDMALLLIFVCAVLYMVGANFNPFIYFRF